MEKLGQGILVWSGKEEVTVRTQRRHRCLHHHPTQRPQLQVIIQCPTPRPIQVIRVLFYRRWGPPRPMRARARRITAGMA